MSARVCLAASAVLLSAAAMAAAAVPLHAAPEVQRGVNGMNVTRVFHSDGGSFEQLDNGRWVEFADDGTLIHEFEEQRRDRSGVWLIDRSRGGVRVEIDLVRREIIGTPAYGRPRLLYRVVDSDADRPGRGWRGRRGGGNWGDGRRGGRPGGDWGRERVEDVQVGPIWNQSDAENKCRAKARELRAEWTGQWHTTVQGRMSVCQIRFR